MLRLLLLMRLCVVILLECELLCIILGVFIRMERFVFFEVLVVFIVVGNLVICILWLSDLLICVLVVLLWLVSMMLCVVVSLVMV